MSNQDLEELSENFLRENDPDYKKKSKPYKSHRQQRRIKAKEYPFSNLSRKQRKQCAGVGDGLETLPNDYSF